MTDVKKQRWHAALEPKKVSSVDLPKRPFKKPTTKHQDDTVWEPESGLGHAKLHKTIHTLFCEEFDVLFQVKQGVWFLNLD